MDNEDLSLEEVPYAFGRCYSLDVKRPMKAHTDYLGVQLDASDSDMIGGPMRDLPISIRA